MVKIRTGRGSKVTRRILVQPTGIAAVKSKGVFKPSDSQLKYAKERRETIIEEARVLYLSFLEDSTKALEWIALKSKHPWVVDILAKEA